MTQPGLFHGALTALVTPFTSGGAIDWPVFCALTRSIVAWALVQ